MHGGHTKITQTRIQAQGQALHFFRVEKADVGHGASEVTATKTGQQRQQLELPQGRVRVAQCHTGTQRRNNQQRGGKEDSVAPATEAHKEAAGNTQGGTGQTGNSHQRKQLRLGERETQVQHLNRKCVN